MAADTRAPAPPPPATAIAASSELRGRVSWGAIIAGFICAVALQTLLTLAGFAWGLATIDPTEEANPFAGLAMGSGIFWTVTSIISLFAGGWIAARLSAVPFTTSSVIHGVSVWALATIFTLFVIISAVSATVRAAATTVGAAATVGGPAIELTANALGTAGRPIAREIREAARRRNLTEEDIRQELRTMYNQVISEREERRARTITEETARDVLRTPGDFSSDISMGLDRMFGTGAPLGDEDRDELVTAMAQRFDISQREAEQIVNRWQTRWQEASQRLDKLYEDARQSTIRAAETGAEAAAGVSVGMAIASLLGLLAAALGAALGRIRPYRSRTV